MRVRTGRPGSARAGSARAGAEWLGFGASRPIEAGRGNDVNPKGPDEQHARRNKPSIHRRQTRTYNHAGIHRKTHAMTRQRRVTTATERRRRRALKIPSATRSTGITQKRPSPLAMAVSVRPGRRSVTTIRRRDRTARYRNPSA